MLFSGSFVAVCVMASVLELGKLVTASFLYRYWKVVNLLQKFYMTISVIVLIGITSMGIFGFLSNSYMGATVEFETMTTKLSVYKDQLEMVLDDKKFLKQELEASVSSLPDNYITAKRKLRNEYNPLIQNKSVMVGELKQKIGVLEIQMVDTGIDIGPLIYISEAFNTDIDTAVKWIIMILICVFDPLAVLLVISFNMTLLRDENDYEIYKKEEINKDRVVTTPDTEEEQLKRMDIIAQNGNDGLHYDETDIVEDDLEIDTEDTSDEDIGIRRGGSDGFDSGRNG